MTLPESGGRPTQRRSALWANKVQSVRVPERKPRARDEQSENHRGERLAGVHDSGAENHADVVEVVGRARHQFAGAIADVKFRLHHEEPIEQGDAHIEFDVARHADQNPARAEGKETFQQNADEESQAVDRNRVAAMRHVEGNPMGERSGDFVLCAGLKGTRGSSADDDAR